MNLKTFIGKVSSHDNYPVTAGHTHFLTTSSPMPMTKRPAFVSLIGEMLCHTVVVLSTFPSMKDSQSFILLSCELLVNALALSLHWVVVFLIDLQDLFTRVSLLSSKLPLLLPGFFSALPSPSQGD